MPPQRTSLKKVFTATPVVAPSPHDPVSRLKATPLFSPQPVVTIVIKTANPDLQSKDNKAASVSDHKFIIHKNFVCHHSPFFAAAFNGRFVEGQTQIMNLDDIDPILFGYFVNWLYTQNVESDFGVGICAENLVKLWILAERFIIPVLQDQVMDKLFDAIGHLRSEAVTVIVKAIQTSGSVILNDLLLNRIPTQKDLRGPWIDELSLSILKRYAKSDFSQAHSSTSTNYHVEAKIKIKGQSPTENDSTGPYHHLVKHHSGTAVTKKPRKKPAK